VSPGPHFSHGNSAPQARPDVSLMSELTAIIAEAATAIRAIETATVAVRRKDDQSPVTAADEASEAVILRHLAGLLPGVPVVSEEAVAAQAHVAPLPARFWLVDPLDGTREFIDGRPEYTVNIALVVDGAPVAGLIAAPAQNLIWRGIVAEGASRVQLDPQGRTVEARPIHTRRAPPDGLVAAVSRSHLDPASAQLLDGLPVVERRSSGSALKFCLIAEGQADVYPRLAPTCEWDIAAGHAIVVAAGGIVTQPEGRPLRYGQTDDRFRVPAFLAWGDPEAARHLTT
jgi:3'(2'), 5'-bisphosphate nucleotidase